jgi:putative membrane protein
MNCYNHIDQTAVGTCIDCGKGLCNECAHKYTEPICDSCNLNRIRKEKSEMIKRWGIILIVAFFITIFYYNISEDKASLTAFSLIGAFYSGIGIQYGWRALNAITPSMFLVLPIIGWFIYFVVKVAISGLIGFFITPIKVFQDVKRYWELKRIIKYAKES